ncbi:AsmA family protein [Nisaea denitrificans]|uniref:AsmA family protein n=1 Tax=Nisaea denitrificans TaxID=390877 RepID=UPI00041A5353|nr:AsmA family protein [Nisaea denitrificans]
MRILKILLLSFLGMVVALAGGAAVYLTSLDEEDVKRIVAEQVQKATGRTLTISGPLTYELSWEPKIRVEDVRFQNAAWAGDADMVSVGTMELDLDLDRVFDGVVIVERLFLEHAKVNLLREADGRANWLLGSDEAGEDKDEETGPSRSSIFPVIESITLIDVDVVYSDKLEGQEHRVDIDSVDLVAPDFENPVEAIVKMSVNGKRIDVAGTLPPAVALGDASAPQPFDISGEAMGQPFRVAGKLLFAYEDGVPANIAVQGLVAHLFSSDISGDLKLDTAGRVPSLSGTLKSQLIDLRQIEALAGPGRGAKSGSGSATGDIRDIMDDRISTDWLEQADIDLSLNVKAFKSSAAEASDIALTVALKDGKLSVSPFWAVYADSPIKLQAEVEKDDRALVAAVDLSIKGADFDRLAGTAMDTAGLEASGDLNVSVKTSGRTVGELMAGATVNAKAALPLVRYTDPAGPGAGRDATISKLDIQLDASGTNPEAVLKLVENVGDIRLDTPLNKIVLKGISGEAHIRAAEVATAQDKVRDLDIAVSLQDQVLSVSIPEMMLAKAKLSASARVEPSGIRTKVSSRVFWKGIDLGVAADRLGADGKASGKADIDIDLIGQGRTIAAMLSSIDGTFGIEMDKVRYTAASAGPDERVEIDTLSLKAESMSKPITGKIAGRFGKKEIDIAGQFPSIKALVEKEQALPFDFNGMAVGEKVAIKGQLTLVQVDDRFTSFKISGLDARIGKSDLTGSLKLSMEGERPKGAIDLASTFLDLEPYLDDGEPAAPRDPAKKVKADAPSDEALDKPFPTEMLDRADGTIKLTVGDLRLPGLVVTNLDLNAALQDRVLSVYPSEGVFNEGLVKLEATVDGSKAPMTGFSIDGTWTGAHFGNVLREYFETEVFRGYGNTSAKLTASGRTPREAMDTVNGHVALYLKDGTVSNTYWELIAADLVTSLLPSIGKKAENESKLNCMATRFDIADGIAKSRVFLVDSSRVTVGGAGTLDLRDEKVDFLLHPKPKDFAFLSLATPIRISGPLSDPTFLPDAAGAAKSAVLGAGAVALTVVNPLALVLPLMSSGETEDPCPAALALAEGKSLEEAAAIGRAANKSSGKGNGAVETGKGVLKLPGKAVDGLFGGIKKVLE